MIACEKCEAVTSSVLVIDVPDYPYDPVAGWFMCEECFAKDPDGWYEVVDAAQFDQAGEPAPQIEAERPVGPARGIDPELLERAYAMYDDGMSLADVAREVMKEHPYKNHTSACASLRVNFKARGWQLHGRRTKAVAA